MVRPSASNLTGWQRRWVKAKASARWELLSTPFSGTRAALTLRRCQPVRLLALGRTIGEVLSPAVHHC